MPVMSNDRSLSGPSITMRWIDLPQSADGLRSVFCAGVSSAVSSNAFPAAAAERPRVAPGQTIPPDGTPVLPGVLIPCGAGGRPGGRGPGIGFSFLISLMVASIGDRRRENVRPASVGCSPLERQRLARAFALLRLQDGGALPAEAARDLRPHLAPAL